MEEKNVILPILPLRGITIFPNTTLSFDVAREKSVKALEAAMENEQMIVLVTQRESQIDVPQVEDLYEIATVVQIKQLLKLPGDSVRVVATGLTRVRILDANYDETHLIGYLEMLEESYAVDDMELEALKRRVIHVFQEYLKYAAKINPEVMMTLNNLESKYDKIADTIAAQLFVKTEIKQKILETLDMKQRYELMFTVISKELELFDLEKKISARVKKQVDKTQKEYYLKEQLRAIQKELGENEGNKDEIDVYRKKLSEIIVPGEVIEKVNKELERLEKLPNHSPDVGVIKSYLDWIFDLPWNYETEDNLDIKNARKILDQDHFGLEKVKERVLEYLAVHKLSQNMKGPIICLVGPPGVGKTSIAKSIAKAINRNFVRMSLGGVRDEAEIRGHRRTYVGAIPGRILYYIKTAKSSNPLFLLDEIDKLGSDAKGDPSSALLEVLDSEQNKDFRDHYLELPYDLSKVLFITTANSMDTIPGPLRDRMEIISISGYTEEEKVRIAMDHLISKQIAEHSLKKSNIIFKEDAVRMIINNYTREAGVRSLEREVARIIRKATVEIVEHDKKRITVNQKLVKEYLGLEKYRYDEANKEDEVGVVTGLAWTSVGGDTLFIEASTMPGTGKLELTGQLGDVMKESAKAALSYIRSKATHFGIESDFNKSLDIHIHVPEGATPKDGPSAGITMTTALVSALTNQAISKDIAMTGEVTLRGRVLPIGGLKEKALAANRLGIKKIIIPFDNARDIEEIPQNVRDGITFIPVKTMDEVLSHALVGEKQ